MIIKDVKVGVMVAAGQALDYKKKKPNANIEEVMRYVIANIEANEEANRGVIAGVSRAIKYKEENPRFTDKEVMQRVMNDINEIVGSFEEE
jgi:hypothetical protein